MIQTERLDWTLPRAHKGNPIHSKNISLINNTNGLSRHRRAYFSIIISSQQIDGVYVTRWRDAGKSSVACKLEGKFSGVGWQDYILQLAPIDVGGLFILASQACPTTHNKLRRNPQTMFNEYTIYQSVFIAIFT